MKFFFLFFASALFSTVNEPLRWNFFSGYRNDRIHWHIEDPGEGGVVHYSELYRDVEYFLNGLNLKVISRDLTFFLKGSYSAFGRGSLKSSPPSLCSSTDGWAADVSGYFGYAVNLTADRTYKVILTPLLGYEGYFEKLQRRSLPGDFSLVWNGFFLGGQLNFDTGGPLLLNVGYAYNFLHNRLHAHLQHGLLKTSSSRNGGQSGWVEIDWKVRSCWRIGLGGEIHYFTTRLVDAQLNHSSQKFILRWTPVSGWGQISRTF